MPAFDPRLNDSSWAGITMQGEMDGQFFTAEMQEAGTMLHVGARGFATFVRNANRSGKITYVLSPKSPTNALLSAAEAQGKIGAWLTNDASDTTITKVSAAEVMIEKHADIKRGKELIGMEWTFLCKELVIKAGGDA